MQILCGKIYFFFFFKSWHKSFSNHVLPIRQGSSLLFFSSFSFFKGFCKTKVIKFSALTCRLKRPRVFERQHLVGSVRWPRLCCTEQMWVLPTMDEHKKIILFERLTNRIFCRERCKKKRKTGGINGFILLKIATNGYWWILFRGATLLLVWKPTVKLYCANLSYWSYAELQYDAGFALTYVSSS